MTSKPCCIVPLRYYYGITNGWPREGGRLLGNEKVWHLGGGCTKQK